MPVGRMDDEARVPIVELSDVEALLVLQALERAEGCLLSVAPLLSDHPNASMAGVQSEAGRVGQAVAVMKGAVRRAVVRADAKASRAKDSWPERCPSCGCDWKVKSRTMGRAHGQPHEGICTVGHRWVEP